MSSPGLQFDNGRKESEVGPRLPEKDCGFIRQHPRILSTYLGVVVSFCVLGFYLLDKPAAYWCRSLDGNIVAVFEFLTKFGISTWYLVSSFLLFLIFRYVNKKELHSVKALFVFLSIGGAGILANVLKVIFGRYRPHMLFDQNLYGFGFWGFGYDYASFPSGHATTVAALAFSLYVIWPRYKYVYLLLAIPVIFSRVILGSHFPTDVVFGSYLAIVATTYLKFLFERKGVKIAPSL